jgi:hypothetical protein
LGLGLPFVADDSAVDPAITPLAVVDKNDGVVKTEFSCPVFVTPRVSE